MSSIAISNAATGASPGTGTSVKEQLLQHGGSSAFLRVLADFEARAISRTVTCAEPCLPHEDFVTLLQDHGVLLSMAEAESFCHQLDKKHTGSVELAALAHFLTALPIRRIDAVLKVWARVQQSKEKEDQPVTVETLLSTYAAAQGEDALTPPLEEASTSQSRVRPAAAAAKVPTPSLEDPMAATRRTALGATFTDEEWKRYKATSTGAAASHTQTLLPAGEIDTEAEEINFDELAAFYAAVSTQIMSDADFESYLAESWGKASFSTHKLGEPVKDGDPMPSGGPRYVAEAINTRLGKPKQTYRYKHMKRTLPVVVPLPPLDREDLMQTTTHRTYGTYSKKETRLADPLATRRGQLS